MVKIEGTLDELRALLGRVESRVDAAIETVEAVEKVAKKTQKVRRKLNDWKRYIRNKSNHIKFKSGKRKGQLDLAAMSKKFKRGRK